MINGLLEFTGSFFILGHCWAMYNAKDSRAVSLLATLFFFTWGLWNVWFFPAHGLYWSFRGGLFMAAANIAWAWLIIYYRWIK